MTLHVGPALRAKDPCSGGKERGALNGRRTKHEEKKRNHKQRQPSQGPQLDCLRSGGQIATTTA